MERSRSATSRSIRGTIRRRPEGLAVGADRVLAAGPGADVVGRPRLHRRDRLPLQLRDRDRDRRRLAAQAAHVDLAVVVGEVGHRGEGYSGSANRESHKTLDYTYCIVDLSNEFGIGDSCRVTLHEPNRSTSSACETRPACWRARRSVGGRVCCSCVVWPSRPPPPRRVGTDGKVHACYKVKGKPKGSRAGRGPPRSAVQARASARSPGASAGTSGTTGTRCRRPTGPAGAAGAPAASGSGAGLERLETKVATLTPKRGGPRRRFSTASTNGELTESAGHGRRA